MTYERFCEKITALLQRVGGISAEFVNDTEAGKYLARCSDGTMLIGNSTSLKLTIRYGTGHQMMAEI